MYSMSRLINLVGNKYGSYIVLEKVIKNNDNNIYWKYICECDCGNIVNITTQHLIDG